MSHVRKNRVPARDLIVQVLDGSPGLSVNDIAAKVYRGRETVINNIADLKKAGRVERVITYRLKKAADQ